MFSAIFSKARKKYQKEMFFPTFLGIFINPFYFSRKALLKHLKELSSQMTGKMLDVGCGNKPYTSLYSVREYVGLEIDSPVNRKKNIADKFYDGNALPFKNDTFDSVVSTQVFEHVPNPDELLDEVFRVLRVNGLFLISVPFVWDEHEQPYDFTRYSSFGIRAILERHGFEILELRKTVDDIRIVFQILNAYIYKKTLVKSNVVNLLTRVCLNAPVNCIGEVLSWFTPSNSDLYLDNIVLAKKRSL